MHSDKIAKLAQHVDHVMMQRSDEVLSIEREEMCRILDSCDLIYYAAWIKVPLRTAPFNSPSLSHVDHYTTYTVTISYKGYSISHKGIMLYYPGLFMKIAEKPCIDAKYTQNQCCSEIIIR
jgi:hypothetical protein